MEKRIPLEKAAVDLCNASAVPPRIYQLPPEQGRKKLDDAQNAPVYKYPADISSHQINMANGLGSFTLYCVRPVKGYYLYRDGMKWFWDQYTTSESDRNHISASPLRATANQLRGLPYALIITDEADVLRDEGEAYAKKLMEAGVDTTAVRINGIVHDFVMLNALDQTNGCRAAMDLATSWINRKNSDGYRKT